MRFLFPIKSRRYWFVDAWVLGNLILAIESVFIVSFSNTPKIAVWIFTVYGILRVFEIFIYQFNVLLVHPSIHSKIMEPSTHYLVIVE